MADSYEFTGIGSGDEFADFDGSQSIPQYVCGEDPTNLEALNNPTPDAATQAVRAACDEYFSSQGGTERENRLDEMTSRKTSDVARGDLQPGASDRMAMYYYHPTDNIAAPDVDGIDRERPLYHDW